LNDPVFYQRTKWITIHGGGFSDLGIEKGGKIQGEAPEASRMVLERLISHITSKTSTNLCGISGLSWRTLETG